MVEKFTALFLTVVTLLWLIEPLFRTAVEGDSDGQAALLSERDRLEELLRDLELDYSTEKMTTEQYEEAKKGLSVRLALVLKRL